MPLLYSAIAALEASSFGQQLTFRQLALQSALPYKKHGSDAPRSARKRCLLRSTAELVEIFVVQPDTAHHDPFGLL